MCAALWTTGFERCLPNCISAWREISEGQVVAVDGKIWRRSFDAASSIPAIYLVSAWF